MLKTYNTIFEDCQGGIVEKKSKFIANVFHIETQEQAKEKIEEIRKKYYDAKHHVYAYRIYAGEIFEKYSDDGEPAQTAGKPIMDLLKQKELYNVLVVVTRYFGGILLGTGGLTRAYTQASNVCLNNSVISQVEYAKLFKFSVSYDEINKIKYYCDTRGIKISKIEYLENIVLEIIVSYEKIDKFENEITDILSRKVEFLSQKEKYVKK